MARPLWQPLKKKMDGIKMDRTNTRKVMVGNVQIGGQNKVVIQSMCNTKTKDVKKTVKQI